MHMADQIIMRTLESATDPPYLVDYKGGDHPPSATNRRHLTKDKDWSDTYREGPSAPPRASKNKNWSDTYREVVRVPTPACAMPQPTRSRDQAQP
jgi:hypothetical protein